MIEPNRQGEVWVFAEQEDGSLHDVALELCGKARELADRLGVKAGAVLAGSNVGDLSAELISHGIDRVYLVDDEKLAHYQTGPYAKVITTLVERHEPQIVVYGATAIGRDLAPRVASTVRSGMTADCTDLDISDVTDPRTKETHPNLLLQIRPRRLVVTSSRRSSTTTGGPRWQRFAKASCRFWMPILPVPAK